MMDNPLLALQVQTPDIAGSFQRGKANASELQTAKLGNMLKTYALQKAQHDDARQNALQQFYQANGVGIAAGDPGAINNLAALDPGAAQGFQKGANENQAAQLKSQSELADFAGRTASYILSAPPEVRPLLYQKSLQDAKDAGHPVSATPPPYSDDLMKQTLAQSMSVKDNLANQVAQQTKAETARHNRADEGAAYGRLAIERAKANEPDFNAPATVEIQDGKGGTKTVLAQQNKRTGQWVSADEKRTPLDATNINIASSANGAGGARTQVQMLRMLSAAHTIGNELENVAALPSTATAGMFGGVNTTSVRGMLTREVTPEDIQSYNTVNTGLSRALGQLEAAGLAPPGSLVHQMEGLTLQKGDTEANRLQKLATVRQTAEGILDSVANSPIASKKQIDEINGLKTRFAKAIPFTPMDVIKLERKSDPNGKTISDTAKGLGLGPQDIPAGDVDHNNPLLK